jgi:hypothetical protein
MDDAMVVVRANLKSKDSDRLCNDLIRELQNIHTLSTADLRRWEKEKASKAAEPSIGKR